MDDRGWERLQAYFLLSTIWLDLELRFDALQSIDERKHDVYEQQFMASNRKWAVFEVPGLSVFAGLSVHWQTKEESIFIY